MDWLQLLLIIIVVICSLLLLYIYELKKKNKPCDKMPLTQDIFLENLVLPYFHKTDALYYNKAFQKAFGMRAKEVALELISLPKQESPILELVFDNGIKKNVQIFFTPLLDAQQHTIAYSGILVDVSTFLRHKETLMLQKERMEFALDALQSGIWDWDMQKESVFFSRRARTILGYGEDEQTLPNLSSWLNLVHSKDIALVHETIAKYLDHKLPSFHVEHRIRDSEPLRWIRVQGEAFFNDANKAIRMVGTFNDITQEKKEQEQMHQENALFHSFFESLPSIAFIKNRTGNYLYLNTAYQQFIGFQPWYLKTARDLFDAQTAQQIDQSDRLALYEGVIEHTIHLTTITRTKETKVVYKFPIQNSQGEKLLCGFSTTINKSLY